MIIFTTSNIYKARPKRISFAENWANMEVCLAEVNDDFDLKRRHLDRLEIYFWWELSSGYFDPLEFDYDYWAYYGIVKGIERVYNVSKEKNIAMAIHTLAANIGEDPIDFFDSQS